MTQPIFTHDCDECVFLGTHNGEDLYVHVRTQFGGYAEAIHRTGDRGWEYGCMRLPHPAEVYQEIERRCGDRGIEFKPF